MLTRTASSAGRAATVRVGSLALALLVSGLLLVLMVCAAYTLTPAVVNALAPSPTPQSGGYWAVVMIPKPTDTPTPLPTPTATLQPTELPSAAPPPAEPIWPSPTDGPSSLTMSIVEDTAVPTSAPQDSGAAPTAVPQYSDSVPSAGKYILVSIRQQHLWAYQDGQLVFSFIASTGSGNSTRTGTFHVLDKIPNAYGANWNIWMPNWMGIYWAGSLEDGIHALPILPSGARLWSGYLGTPISYGCVVLGVNEAQQLYDWAEIGTPVQIVW